MPSSGATLTTQVDDWTPAPRRSQVSDLRPELVRLALVVVVDVLLLLGVLLPYLTSDGEVADQWLPDVFMPAVMLSVFFWPWVAFGCVAVSGYRLWRGGPLSPASRVVCLTVVVLGAAGFVTYFSPWGMGAIRWLMD